MLIPIIIITCIFMTGTIGYIFVNKNSTVRQAYEMWQAYREEATINNEED